MALQGQKREQELPPSGQDEQLGESTPIIYPAEGASETQIRDEDKEPGMIDRRPPEPIPEPMLDGEDLLQDSVEKDQNSAPEAGTPFVAIGGAEYRDNPTRETPNPCTWNRSSYQHLVPSPFAQNTGYDRGSGGGIGPEEPASEGMYSCPSGFLCLNVNQSPRRKLTGAQSLTSLMRPQ